MNTGAPWPDSNEAWWRVRKMQIKLHQWALDDPNRRFKDLYNLVCDPAFLVVAWERVRGNRGARSAGVDGVKPRSIVFGNELLARLRDDLKAGRFTPLPVRERLIPKKGGKLRGLGIPTARDRVVQAALLLVLEILANPAHPEHDSRREWIDRPFDPEVFDPSEFEDNLRNGRLAAFDDEA